MARHGPRRPSTVILVIMQEARDLALRRSCLGEVGKRTRVFKEFPLDFGRESTPSHDDGRSQTFQNFLVFGGSLINLQRSVFDTLMPGLFRADMEAPPSSSHRAIAAAWWITSL
jgi:hypothetical protein